MPRRFEDAFGVPGGGDYGLSGTVYRTERKY
jgi:hypothetical protein